MKHKQCMVYRGIKAPVLLHVLAVGLNNFDTLYCALRGVGRGFPWVQETPFNFQYITQSSTSDITNHINVKNFEAQTFYQPSIPEWNIAIYGVCII